MKTISKIKLVAAGLLFVSMNVFAYSGSQKIGNTTLFYQYYPNPQAKFKGTIIFQNGSGTPMTEWTQNRKFINCVKQYGNVFIYDRSGLGDSPPDLSMSSKKPMTAKLINDKLEKLLVKAHIKPPYIVVAHSYGGMYAGYFVRKHPDLVKGVVMIDPVPHNYEWSSKLYTKHHTTEKDTEKMKRMSSKQLYSQYGFDKTNKTNSFSAQLFYQIMGFKQSQQQISNLPPLSKNIPVTIISSTYMQKNAPIKGNWYNQQKQWLSTNPHSKIMKVNSGHFIQLEHPKLVCNEIGKVISEAKE